MFWRRNVECLKLIYYVWDRVDVFSYIYCKVFRRVRTSYFYFICFFNFELWLILRNNQIFDKIESSLRKTFCLGINDEWPGLQGNYRVKKEEKRLISGNLIDCSLQDKVCCFVESKVSEHHFWHFEGRFQHRYEIIGNHEWFRWLWIIIMKCSRRFFYEYKASFSIPKKFLKTGRHERRDMKKNYTISELMKFLITVNNLNRGSKKSGRFIFKFTKVRNERDFFSADKVLL